MNREHRQAQTLAVRWDQWQEGTLYSSWPRPLRVLLLGRFALQLGRADHELLFDLVERRAAPSVQAQAAKRAVTTREADVVT
jgi:hypothetical protein